MLKSTNPSSQTALFPRWGRGPEKGSAPFLFYNQHVKELPGVSSIPPSRGSAPGPTGPRPRPTDATRGPAVCRSPLRGPMAAVWPSSLHRLCLVLRVPRGSKRGFTVRGRGRCACVPAGPIRTRGRMRCAHGAPCRHEAGQGHGSNSNAGGLSPVATEAYTTRGRMRCARRARRPAPGPGPCFGLARNTTYCL